MESVKTKPVVALIITSSHMHENSRCWPMFIKKLVSMVTGQLGHDCLILATDDKIQLSWVKLSWVCSPLTSTDATQLNWTVELSWVASVDMHWALNARWYRLRPSRVCCCLQNENLRHFPHQQHQTLKRKRPFIIYGTNSHQLVCNVIAKNNKCRFLPPHKVNWSFSCIHTFWKFFSQVSNSMY
jgi:hypothetical protein